MLIGIAHIIIIIACLALAVPFGRYMAKVFNGEKNLLTPVFRPVERGFYRLCGIDENREMSWKRYLLSFFGFNLLGIIYLFVLLLLQGRLPLNPQHLASFRWDTALNIATSFVTNTEWQAYSGEREMSYLSQILGVTVMDFIGPAVGLVCAIALARGFARKNFATVGNFWVDVTRCILYVMVPVAVPFAIVFVSQGTIQNLNHYTVAHTLEGGQQLIPGGPAASVSALKLFGEDGGGFFNVNSVHPFEVPTPLMYALELFIILLVPAALCFTYGEIFHNRKIGWALFIAMLLLIAMTLPLYLWAEAQGNPILAKLGVAGGVNMEGKDMRFTIFEDMLFTGISMPPANGSIITQHDSLLPLSLLAILFNIVIGAPVFGCWGTGIITMVYYFILAAFLGGLMSGRGPEIAGKKIEPLEIILGAASLLFSSLPTLILTAIAIALPVGLAGLNNTGPHGLTEIFYNYASICVNNGSPAAGLTANTPFYNLTIIVGMVLGRYSTDVTALIIAGSLARKKIVPVTSGTLPVTSPVFIIMVIGTVIIISALTFFPALMLGPILEHLLMQLGWTF